VLDDVEVAQQHVDVRVTRAKPRTERAQAAELDSDVHARSRSPRRVARCPPFDVALQIASAATQRRLAGNGDVVRNAFHQTVRAWDGSYYVPRFTSEQAGRAGRVVVGCLLALGLLYCGTIAYEVIQDLREVKLADLRMVLYRVSVGDALLTWFAWVFGRDLLRGAVSRDRF